MTSNLTSSRAIPRRSGGSLAARSGGSLKEKGGGEGEGEEEECTLC